MRFDQKLAVLKRLASEHACKVFVETGTYEAKMAIAMAAVCGETRTIELDKSLHQEACRTVQSKKANVKLYLGSSVLELPNALDGVENPLLWLDAHWSGGKTTRDDSGSDTPIVEELNVLKRLDVRGIVAIDDLRCFDGRNGYPTFEQLRELVRERWPSATLVREDDLVWFVTHP